MEGSIIVEKLSGEDLRMKIIQDIIGKGGVFTTGFFMRRFYAIAALPEKTEINF